MHIPMHGLLEPGQPLPHCNCGFDGDAESVASLTGIEKNLLPYWLTRYPDHELAKAESLAKAAKLVRAYGENGDPMALAIFEQQAKAVGRLFTIAANFTDPDAYFVGGGVVEAAAHFREWFLAKVRENTALKEEQARGRALRGGPAPRHGRRPRRRDRRPRAHPRPLSSASRARPGPMSLRARVFAEQPAAPSEHQRADQQPVSEGGMSDVTGHGIDESASAFRRIGHLAQSY